MKDKGHFYVSLAKSTVRIGGCILAIRKKSVFVLAGAMLLAELLGVAEEVFDKR